MIEDLTKPSKWLKTNQSDERKLLKKNFKKPTKLVTSKIYILPIGAIKVDTGKAFESKYGCYGYIKN